jgi:hypothetical protein
MRRWTLAATMVLLFVGYCAADGIDEAEAKRRGVPISQVQLENAKTKIADMQKEISLLQSMIEADKEIVAKARAQAAAALSALAKEEDAKRAEAASRPAELTARITSLFNGGQVKDGMSLDSLEKLIGTKGRVITASSDGMAFIVWGSLEGTNLSCIFLNGQLDNAELNNQPR